MLAIRLRASTLTLLLSAALAACTQANVHETEQARGKACFSCHYAAYSQVQTPLHVGVYPNTCDNCHSTAAWFPASAGHPEAKFPITTGSHKNAAIGCSDCHIASLGSSVAGANADCIHCHIGAHLIPTIDGRHTAVANYAPANPATPHSCLGCHPKG